MTQEIEWSERPNYDLSHARHDIVRCGPGSLRPHIVLNDEIVGAELHWFQGRSTPHLKKDCPFCGPGKQTVWKGHICGLCEMTKKCVIVEFTAPCIDQLNEYKLRHGTLRGARLKLHRTGGKPNGKLFAQVEPSGLGTNELPEPFDLRAALHFMWNSRRDLANIRTESPRVVVDGPANNEELARKRPSRFATNGHNPTEVYSATEEQLRMIDNNRVAAGKLPLNAKRRLT